jgi:SulP family sulfate permease
LVENLEDHLPTHVLVIDLKNVIYVDSTGAEALENLTHACRARGVRLVVSGVVNQPRDIAQRTGLLALWAAQSPDDVQPDVRSAVAVAVATTDTDDVATATHVE